MKTNRFVNREKVIYYTELYASTKLVLKGSDNLQLCRVIKEVNCSIVDNVCNSLLNFDELRFFA